MYLNQRDILDGIFPPSSVNYLENGVILSIVGEQAVVRPVSELPKIGEDVFVKTGRLGKVCDIIGPVESPYFIVKLEKGAKAETGKMTMRG